MNVNSDDRVNASTIHGISSPRLCSEKCRCGEDKIGKISKYCDEKKLAKSILTRQKWKITITGPQLGAATGFGTERLHPGVDPG